MTERWTKTAAFGQFDTTLVNTRWSWSGISKDRRVVVLALWRDRFETTGLEYHEKKDAPSSDWINLPGNRYRRHDLAWAQQYCGGTFRVVLATAEDMVARTRSGTNWTPRPDILMRITYVKPTGQFGAELIEGAPLQPDDGCRNRQKI